MFRFNRTLHCLSQRVGLRFYSPVRSRIPRPPLRRVQKADIQPSQQPSWTTQTDGPGFSGVLPAPLSNLISEPTIVIERELELMNVIMSFEQARRYTLYRPNGETIGYMEEVDFGFTRAIARQITRLHRPFTIDVYDAYGRHAMTIRRPFSFINSHIKCLLPGATESPDKENDPANIIGESRQEWHLWRRRYNLYGEDSEATMDQFGRVDAPFLSFQFPVQDANGALLGAVDRNWVGLAREMFTDTGVYLLRQTPQSLAEIYDAPLSPHEMTLQQRCVMLATAVSIDYDYFSRHSRGPGVGYIDDV